jgi:hypothetical protein
LQDYITESQRSQALWHHGRKIFAEVAMEWWLVGVELGVPAIIGIALYLALRK